MIRIIGAILIITASTMIGYLISRKYRDRPKQLRQWRSALQSLEAEIVYGLAPIEDVARHLSEQLPRPLSLFFAYLSERLEAGEGSLEAIWEESVQQFWPNTALGAGEKEVLLQFGTTLGKQDAGNQKKHIRLALSHLEREELEAREAQTRYEKMAKSLGFLAGVLIVLLLI
ncbi:stage III sporulation protein SpoIIIAB [Terrilactibacillus sp. S3-3]|nr:stage III sporulation protein SpoIIIAB [Terrilactibacillus sp. S3-3]